MRITIESRHLQDVVVVVPEIFKDGRGFFSEVFRADQFKELGLPTEFVQDNHSRSARGVVRGLHFQWDPPMGKLMRVTLGSAFLVAVDIRKGSPTLGKWAGVEASDENRRQVWAPAGFARGFCVLSEVAEIQYKCTGIYSNKAESGILWNDPQIGIEWPLTDVQLSDKDRKAQTLAQWLASPESANFSYESKVGAHFFGRKIMKVLVVGGAGYLGSVLIPRLLDRGYKVDVVDLFWFGNHLPRQVGILNQDLFQLTVEDLEAYDQVVFLAGLSNDPMAEYSPSKNFIFNAAAPAYLAYMAKLAKVKRYVYASSCSVYGYTENELYDETRAVGSTYPYGISKLQGEQAALQLVDDNFSVISLRKGTISGYSPRMRLDLIINTMFKTALRDNTITINNPSIWRPILSIEDAATAYIRAIEANYKISGIFNVASGNYTVGEIGDLVKNAVEERLGKRINLCIKHIQDFRNYKVSIETAKNVLSFHPAGDVKSIVMNLIDNMEKFQDWDNPLYSNIQAFKSLESGIEVYAMAPSK